MVRVGGRVGCSNPDHRALGCRKFCASTKFVAALGVRGPSLYLECWLAMAGDMEHGKHRKKRPTLAEVKRYMESK